MQMCKCHISNGSYNCTFVYPLDLLFIAGVIYWKGAVLFNKKSYTVNKIKGSSSSSEGPRIPWGLVILLGLEVDVGR